MTDLPSTDNAATDNAAADNGTPVPPAKAKSGRAKVRTFSATEKDHEMLAAIARYHGITKSAMIAGLIRKEFWRIFPQGTAEIAPDQGAKLSHE